MLNKLFDACVKMLSIKMLLRFINTIKRYLDNRNNRKTKVCYILMPKCLDYDALVNR